MNDLNKYVTNAVDDLDSQAAAKDYWRQYKRQWAREKRSRYKSYTVFMTPQEAAQLAAVAADADTSCTGYIRQSVLEQMRQGAATAPAYTVRQVLMQSITELCEDIDDAEIPGAVQERILSRVCDLERRILEALHLPTENSE